VIRATDDLIGRHRPEALEVFIDKEVPKMDVLEKDKDRRAVEQREEVFIAQRSACLSEPSGP
jgi:hypothetical protein